MNPEQAAPPFASQIMVALTLDTENFQNAIDDAGSRMDDRYWSYYVMQRFTWQRFQNWWAARRWVQPRDVRRR